MSDARKVLIYGASGYTGKLVAESLARRNIPFYMAGRTLARLETALAVVEERHGQKVDAELVTGNHSLGDLVELLKRLEIKVLINNVGPFMQLGWPVVEACLEAGVHYLDTTGEQDWTAAIGEKYGAAFAAKGLLLCPANSFMWAAGALAAEVVLETPGVDSLDICYQIDNGLPSEASTKSFLRMVCNDVSQYYLEQNELKAWPNDVAYKVAVPYRNAILSAHPWGGACEPIWFKDDPRVRNCKVLTAMGEHLIEPVMQAIRAFNAVAPGLTQEQREEWTNRMGEQMDSGEPPKDSLDVQRGVIVVHGQGRQVTTSYVMNLSAAYTWTGDICAESAARLLDGQLKQVGFQSAAKAFGHRELIQRFHELGFCSALPA
ncbi:Saccharopine dehydrogenase NADP binding domain protein [compost metagenome]